MSVPAMNIVIGIEDGKAVAAAGNVESAIRRVGGAATEAGKEEEKAHAAAGHGAKVHGAVLDELQHKFKEHIIEHRRMAASARMVTNQLNGLLGKGNEFGKMAGELLGGFAIGGVGGLAVEGVKILTEHLFSMSEEEKRATEELDKWFQTLDQRKAKALSSIQEMLDKLQKVTGAGKAMREASIETLSVETKKREAEELKRTIEEEKEKMAAEMEIQAGSGLEAGFLYNPRLKEAEAKLKRLEEEIKHQEPLLGSLNTVADLTKKEEIREADAKLEVERKAALKQSAEATQQMFEKTRTLSIETSGLTEEEVKMAKALLTVQIGYEKEVEKIEASKLSTKQKADEIKKLTDQYYLNREAVKALTEQEIAKEEAKKKAEQDKKIRSLQTFVSKAGDAGEEDPEVKLVKEKLREFDKLAAEAGLQKGSEEYNVQLSILLSNLDQVVAKQERAKFGVEEFSKVAAKNMREYVNKSMTEFFDLSKGLGTIFDDLGNGFVKMVEKMVAELAASQLLQVLQQLSAYVFGAPSATSIAAGDGYVAAPVGVAGYAASGGMITGPGGPTDDQIPTMLSNGEFVVNAAAVSRVGSGFLESLNSGSAPTHYADGGSVGTPKAKASGDVEVNIVNNTGQQTTTARRNDGDKEIVDVIIGAVADSIKGGGMVGKAIEGRYGVQKVGISRG